MALRKLFLYPLATPLRISTDEVRSVALAGSYRNNNYGLVLPPQPIKFQHHRSITTSTTRNNPFLHPKRVNFIDFPLNRALPPPDPAFAGALDDWKLVERERKSELNIFRWIHANVPTRHHRRTKPLNIPFAKAVVLRAVIKKPKKPNSANRKCVKVRLRDGRELYAHVPGEGHNLQEHNVVRVRNGRCQDLVNVKLKVVRGKLDCAPVKKKTALGVK